MNEFKTPKGTKLFLIQLKGKPYLPVAERIIWFREERPTWSIETQLVEHTKDYTLAKATIKDETGRIIAQAHKHENTQGFADHAEKSETGSIGRALALCGFGTQFCSDDLNEGERLADAPRNTPSHIAPKPKTNAQLTPPDAVKTNIAWPDDGKEPGDYVCTFGKNKGQKVKDIAELFSYVKFLKSAEKLSGPAIDFLAKAEKYLSRPSEAEPKAREIQEALSKPMPSFDDDMAWAKEPFPI